MAVYASEDGQDNYIIKEHFWIGKTNTTGVAGEHTVPFKQRTRQPVSEMPILVVWRVGESNGEVCLASVINGYSL